jgi:fimbrial isopeptide formation D2 family protein
MKQTLLLLVMLFTFSFTYSQIPENFEGAGVTVPNGIPLGWLVTDNGVGTTSSWEITNDPTLVLTGTKSASINRHEIGIGNTSEDWLISPAVVIPYNGQLRFFTRQTLPGDNGTVYQIRISTGTSQSNLASYTVLKQWTEEQLNQIYDVSEEKVIDFPFDSFGVNVYIAFVRVYAQPTAALGGDRWLIDDINVTLNCVKPSNATVNAVAATSANLSWIGTPGAESYEIEFVPANVPATGVATDFSIQPNYIKTGLTQSSAYHYWVRSNCGDGNFSEWTGPVSFSTLILCSKPVALTVTNITATSAKLGWMAGGAETQWEVLLLAAANAIAPASPQVNSVVGFSDIYIQNVTSSTTTISNLNPSTIYYYYVRTVCQSVNAASYWTGPYIFNTVTCNEQDKCTYKFYLTSEGFNNWNYARMEVRQNGVLVATLGTVGVNNQDGIAVSICNNVPFDLYWNIVGTQPQGIGIRIENSFGDTIYTKLPGEGTPLTVLYTDITLENCAPPTCPKPQNINATLLTPTSVALSWSEASLATQWEVYATEFGNPAPLNGTPLNTNNSSYLIANSNQNFVISNLNPTSDYQYYIRSICSSTDLSTWKTIPNISSNHYKLVAFVDTNSNGLKDAGESNFEYGTYAFEKNNDGITYNMGSSLGSAEIYNYLSTNTYDFSFEIDSELLAYYAMAPVSYVDIGVTVGVSTQTFYFPITITQVYNDVQVALVAMNAPRPGFPYTHQIVYKNVGHNPSSGTISYTKDNANIAITSTLPTATTTTANGFTYNYTNLLPGQTATILVNMQVATIPTVNLGDVVTNIVSITPIETDVNLANNGFTITQTVVGSYDPNDKTEARGENVQIGQFTQGDYLYYTIRFQNTGTASAETVRIEDTLESDFDFASVRMISASHDYTMERINNKLVWTFNTINLPSENANEPGSHGYVLFKIKLNTGFAVGDVIENTAAIYFDFNPPIITNTFQTTFVPNLSTGSFEASNLVVYPNPAREVVQITLRNSTETMSRIVIYDIIGKAIKTISGNNAQQATVNISDLSTGVYMIEITTDSHLKQIRKFIVN